VIYQDCYINVYETPYYGRLDEASNEKMKSDVAIIRTYIRAEKKAAMSAPNRRPPPIARKVLTSIWEKPRIDFHRAEKKKFRKLDLRNKLLLIPWSIEAFEYAKTYYSVRGLILEHVTPIDWMWRKLKELDVDPDNSDVLKDDEMWELNATTYLFNHYMVAVLTGEQSTAIDAVRDLKRTGYEPNPFIRYRYAEKQIDIARAKGRVKPSFSVAKFVLPARRSTLPSRHTPKQPRLVPPAQQSSQKNWSWATSPPDPVCGGLK
jgi:hypothetical protein